MPKGTSLRGRVTSATGKPLASATVAAYGSNTYDEQSATTGEDGKYEVTGLGEKQNYVVVFSAENHAVLPIWKHKTGRSPGTLDVALTSGTTIRGRVSTSAGAPLANLLVKVEWKSHRMVRFEMPSAITDEDGTYVLPYVPPGRLLLVAGAETKNIAVRDGKDRTIDVAVGEPG